MSSPLRRQPNSNRSSVLPPDADFWPTNQPTGHTVAWAWSGPEPAVAIASARSAFRLADIILDVLLASPHDSMSVAANQINAKIAPELELRLTKPAEAAPQPPEGQRLISQTIRNGSEEAGMLHLLGSVEQDETASRAWLVVQIAAMMGKLAAALQDRHNRLQKLAITDELSVGSYNSRYFKHFLTSILDRARAMHFPVTLLLFDIDDFKRYNDQFGHPAGDEILKQAAALMKRCTRQHDLVARIGGDEFAVVFWDKEGPRQPRDPRSRLLFPRARQQEPAAKSSTAFGD